MNIVSAEAEPGTLSLCRSDAGRLVAPKPTRQGTVGASGKPPLAAPRAGSAGLAGRLCQSQPLRAPCRAACIRPQALQAKC